MNKDLLLKLLQSLLRISIKLLIFSMTIILSVFFSDGLRKKINERQKEERDYDEYTANVTKRKFYY
jgi:hypothetical protein